MDVTFNQLGLGPVSPQQHIMNPAECLQPTFNSFAPILKVLSGSETLRCYGLHRRQDVFDAMVEFFHHDPLQLLGDLLLCGIDAGLGKQSAEIEVLGL